MAMYLRMPNKKSCPPQEMVDLRRRGLIRGYHRYMDDIVILTKTRWQLRKAIKIMHGVLADLKLTCHGDRKRFIGRVTCAFDFLGYEFRRDRLLRPSGVGIDCFRNQGRHVIIFY